MADNASGPSPKLYGAVALGCGAIAVISSITAMITGDSEVYVPIALMFLCVAIATAYLSRKKRAANALVNPAEGQKPK